jgi:hypothetical protein
MFVVCTFWLLVSSNNNIGNRAREGTKNVVGGGSCCALRIYGTDCRAHGEKIADSTDFVANGRFCIFLEKR